MKRTWRLRAVIETEIVISPGQFNWESVTLKVFPINGENTQNGNHVPERVRYCDITWESNDCDVIDAFAFLSDKLEKFLDRYAMYSYGAAKLLEIKSVCPVSVRVGESFPIAIPQFSKNRKTKQVRLEEAGLDAEFSDEQDRWVRLLKNGLSSVSTEERFVCFYSLLEEIARLESKEYIITSCSNPSCGKEVNTGRKKTSNFILNLLELHGVEKKLRKKVPGLRNKITHGGAIKDKMFLKAVNTVGSHLEEICLLELEKRLPLKIVNRLNAHIVDVPVVTHECLCTEGGGFELIRSNLKIPARFVKLKHTDDKVFDEQSAEIGLPLDSENRPPIDPFSWPEIIG